MLVQVAGVGSVNWCENTLNIRPCRAPRREVARPGMTLSQHEVVS